MSVLSQEQNLSATPRELTDESKQLAAGYTYTQRLLELSGVTLYFGLCATTVVNIALHCTQAHVGAAAITAVIAAATIVGLLAADFASGFVHWAADNWGSADWPIVGAAFIRPFRHHHVDPQDITHHSFLELNGNNCIVSLPLFYVSAKTMNMGGAQGLFVGTFFFALAIWVLATNQFHAWAHTTTPPKAVQALQSVGLILSKTHHQVHHNRPHNGNYCITTGWLNAPLRALHFFEAIEAVMTKLSGVSPNHKRLKPLSE